MPPKKWTNEAIISEVRQVMALASITDRMPTVAEIKDHSNVYPALNKYGGIQRFADLMGLPVTEYYDKTCTLCGKEYKSKNKGTRFCSQRCRNKAAYIPKSRSKPKPKKKQIRSMKDIKPSKADEIEAGARKKGLSYADLQKAKTLDLVGRIEV